MVVWKFGPLLPNQPNWIQLPIGANVLAVKEDPSSPGEISLWALRNLGAETESRKFIVVGTGRPMDEWDKGPIHYIGSVVLANCQEIYHVFEAVENE